MLQSNYRVDTQTGAVIFKKSAGRKKSQQMERDISELLERVNKLENINKILIKTLEENGIIIHF